MKEIKVIQVRKKGAAAAVSIIGGADGPTSIFLAGKIGKRSFVPAAAAGGILLLSGIILIITFIYGICRKN